MSINIRLDELLDGACILRSILTGFKYIRIDNENLRIVGFVVDKIIPVTEKGYHLVCIYEE